jgi:hypothetical protein
VRRQTALRVLC